MAINYASQFAPKVVETFSRESLTDSACGREFQFTGSKSVKVLTVDTVPLNDYNRSGTSRYGEPVELGDTVQEMIMGDDKSFTMTIDKGNNIDQMNLKGAAEAMKREVAQVVVPYIDKYRLQAWCKKAGLLVYMEVSKAEQDLLPKLFEMGAEMDNAGVPIGDRTLFIANKIYKHLVLSDKLISVKKLGESALAKGIVGELNGMVVKRVPDSYMPTGVLALAKWKNCTADPVKLQEGKIHKDPPGLSGNLLEGRIYQDAFVLVNKCNGLCILADAARVPLKPVVTVNSSSGTVTMSCPTSSTTIHYTTDGTDPRYSETAQRYTTSFSVPKGTVLKAYSTNSYNFTQGVVEKIVTW